MPALARAGRWEVAAVLLIAERFGKSIRTPARHYIGGAFRAPATRAELSVIDPSDGKPFASIARGDAPDVDVAVRERALDAGFDLVVPRSRMNREAAELVTRLAEDPGR